MGWFWTEHPVPAHGRITNFPPDRLPPLECPMRRQHLPPHFPPSSDERLLKGSCPVAKPPPAFSDDAQSPPATASTSAYPSLSKLNPLNYMFANLSQERSPHQNIHLPVQRTVSSIPRGDSDENWEYPSPQQMYNAMLRKGYTDTPEDAVESMVAVHNYLNEGAWREIVEWERRFSRGLGRGWRECGRGEASAERGNFARRYTETGQDDEVKPPRLMRFMGRPGEMTPKATVLQFMGRIYPSRFNTEPPFDRHDWVVIRQTPSGPREIRYVIDYYSAPPDPSGEEVFYLDVRPALDRPGAVAERLMRWSRDVWWRASGGAARDDDDTRT